MYFGKGLGKKGLSDPSKKQHSSENLIDHGDHPSYLSTYTSGYKKSQEERQGSAKPGGTINRSTAFVQKKELLDKFHTVSTKQSFHRFPRKHSLLKDKEMAKPSVNTVWWWSHNTNPPTVLSRAVSSKESNPESRHPVNPKNQKSHTTPLGVLAATQQPFLKTNEWKYWTHSSRYI